MSKKSNLLPYEGEKINKVVRKTKRRVKTRTFSGVVCEQEVYTVSPKATNLKKAKPRLRFRNEEERLQHREGISRRNHAKLGNENFSPTSYYSTLTFDTINEVHTFRGAKYVRDLYIRRLKYAYPDAVIFFYLGRGKATRRIHGHMISEGIPPEVVTSKWNYGEIVAIDSLREHNYYNGVDYGQDYTGLANYLFDHWSEEQGGHRWKQTRNTRKPEREEPKEVKRAYSEDKPPTAPKGYILVESRATKYGYMYFKYVKEPPEDDRKRRKKLTDSS